MSFDVTKFKIIPFSGISIIVVKIPLRNPIPFIGSQESKPPGPKPTMNEPLVDSPLSKNQQPLGINEFAQILG